MVRFTIWGPMRPTNPIIPMKETTTAVMSADTISPATRVREVFTPSPLAMSSPDSMAL